MDSFNGYKLKPSSYKIQLNDIIIRVEDGTTPAPVGTLAILLEDHYLSLPHNNRLRWLNNIYKDWRAIETRPGSEAKVGDTVYCIKDTGGDCKVHDLFIVDSTTNYYLYPIANHKLLNGTITNVNWSWERENFVVLVKAEEKNQIQNIVSPEDAQPGDYVIWDDRDLITAMTRGKAYKVIRAYNNTLTVRNNEGRSDLWSKSRFKNIDKIQQQQQEEETSTTNFIPFTIVHSKGDERTCIGLSTNNWYISKNHIGCKVLHNPQHWTKKETTDDTNPIDFKKVEDIVRSMFNDAPINTVSIDSMMNKPTQTKPNLKEKQMNPNLFTDILKLLAQAEQTDLQKAPSTYAFFYNNEGKYEGTARVANETEAKALLQKPEHLGYTMRIYSFSDEFTTQIPVVSTIKKTVVAEPAAKSTRKPRVSKAN